MKQPHTKTTWLQMLIDVQWSFPVQFIKELDKWTETSCTSASSTENAWNPHAFDASLNPPQNWKKQSSIFVCCVLICHCFDWFCSFHWICDISGDNADDPFCTMATMSHHGCLFLHLTWTLNTDFLIQNQVSELQTHGLLNTNGTSEFSQHQTECEQMHHLQSFQHHVEMRWSEMQKWNEGEKVPSFVLLLIFCFFQIFAPNLFFAGKFVFHHFLHSIHNKSLVNFAQNLFSWLFVNKKQICRENGFTAKSKLVNFSSKLIKNLKLRIFLNDAFLKKDWHKCKKIVVIFANCSSTMPKIEHNNDKDKAIILKAFLFSHKMCMIHQCPLSHVRISKTSKSKRCVWHIFHWSFTHENFQNILFGPITDIFANDDWVGNPKLSWALVHCATSNWCDWATQAHFSGMIWMKLLRRPVTGVDWSWPEFHQWVQTFLFHFWLLNVTHVSQITQQTHMTAVTNTADPKTLWDFWDNFVFRNPYFWKMTVLLTHCKVNFLFCAQGLFCKNVGDSVLQVTGIQPQS